MNLSDFGRGIYAIDSGFGRPNLDAVHLILHEGRAALIDAAVNAGVPRVLEALASLGLAREAIDYVILTHVHLDHAGGAGALMQALPNARLTVHPRGARHMIDPAKLTTATYAVYGEAKARAMYGDIVPVPQQRVIETPDGATIKLAGRELLFLDTPVTQSTTSASATRSPGTSLPATPSASSSANSTPTAAATSSRR